MNTSPHSRRAVALIIVLAFLVLISGIVIAFFSGVTTQLSFSKSSAIGATTQQLADSAVNVVMAQIVDGTKGIGKDKSTLAWASQPGMIRSYNSEGKAVNCFKLYSSGEMVVEGEGFAGDGDLPPETWSSPSNAGLYTDLNAPILVEDPEGAIKPNGAFPEERYTPIYPILDPSAEDVVDGFWFDTRPGYVDGSNAPDVTMDPTRAVAGGKSANPAPMPVKWLYVLKDGSLQGASQEAGGAVKVAKATKENPITGRIAFWADDDSCKVNLNTASEGTYWDVPRVYSMEDFGQIASGGVVKTPGLAVSQPANGEYQRYPGHPATTSLSPIFGKLWKLSSPPKPKELEPYYEIAPRIGQGGSTGGFVRPPKKLPPELLPLYASVDELMFTSFNINKPFTGARVPNPALPGVPNITKAWLEKAKFFTTISSSAPETTLFNTPRIGMWPVHRDAAKRTAYDNQAAFCGTIGPPNQPVPEKAYYFDRVNSRSPTADFTKRNPDLYAYLRALTDRQIPGFGGSFSRKYPAAESGVSERDQILTYLYDYIRCTNLQDRSKAGAGYTKLFHEGRQPGSGEVVPIRPGNNTQGFGRFYSVSEADIIFYATKGTKPNQNTPSVTSEMKAVFILEFATPMQGLGAMRCGLRYTVKGLEKLQVKFGSGDWSPLGFKPSGTNYMEREDLAFFHGRSLGGTEGPYQAIANKGLDKPGSDERGKYPFVTVGGIKVGPTDRTFEFRMLDPTGEVTVEMTDEANKSVVIQTVNLRFPSTQLTTPKVAGGAETHKFEDRLASNGFALINDADTVIGLEPAGLGGGGSGPDKDPTAGDIRMVEGLEKVPAERFRAHRDYSKPGGAKMAHGLVSSIGLGEDKVVSTVPLGNHRHGVFFGGTYGKLVNVQSTGSPARPYGQVAAENARQPDVPSRVGDAVFRSDGQPGDWDTGFGDQKDGAHINKPDEGDTEFEDRNSGETRPPYLFGFGEGFASGKGEYFSPNRQIPSSLMFGSIPTGVQRFLPWQTLLFHPRPEDPAHPGNGKPRRGALPYTEPPDHLLADLFWMPVVEPYAISQPFSTSGKVNMNYAIQPFSYIRRDTAVRAVLKSTKFLAIPLTASSTYKPLDPGNNKARTANLRKTIDLPTTPKTVPNTLKAFDEEFKEGLFRSATQICEINLVPPGVTLPALATKRDIEKAMATFWTNNPLTGDNVREKPYADIYPRLTTKSNVYTVHVRVQALKKNVNSPPGEFRDPESAGSTVKDQVLSEYRGSTTIERYVDLNDPKLPDFAKVMAKEPSDEALNIDQYYRFRVLGTKRFAP